VAQKVEYEPTEAEAIVLLTGAQDAATLAGAVAGGAAGAAGGRAGVRLTRARTAVAALDVAKDPDVVRRLAREAIEEFGIVIDDPNAAADGSVWGLVDSGAMNLTVALVRVGVLKGLAGGSTVEIRGTGQEGLIKQRIGAKAADRIAARLAAT
jgi:hypothetical protein